MSQNCYKPMTLTGTIGAQGTSDYTELPVDPNGRRHIVIRRVTIVPAADGSATTYQPLITDGDGVSGTIGQLYLGASTSIGDTFDVTNIEAYARTDSNGSIWIAFIPDAGSDNTFAYELHLGVW